MMNRAEQRKEFRPSVKGSLGAMDYHNYQQPRMTLQLPKITWGVQRLILLNAAIFALQLVLGPLETLLGGAPGLHTDYLGFQPDWFFYGFIWTPLTYMFLHGGLMHLFMNMLWLFVFGPDVERLLGTRQFIRFYVACGALGVLATVGPYLLGGPSATVIGASGAAMGVLVAFAMIDPQRQFFMFPLPVPITAVWLVILVVLFNLVTLSAGTASISVATHFGGMLAGGFLMKAIPLYHRRRFQGSKLHLYNPESPDSAFDLKVERLREAVDRILRKHNKL
jgi:membrane associated rhomboid family serine protease